MKVSNMLTKVERDRIANRLQDLADGEPPTNYKWGLCNDLNKVVEAKLANRFVSEQSVGWEHHSGSKDYPVPSNDGATTPFRAYHDTYNLWIGQQGEFRRDLCRYLLEKLKWQDKLTKKERKHLRDQGVTTLKQARINAEHQAKMIADPNGAGTIPCWDCRGINRKLELPL